MCRGLTALEVSVATFSTENEEATNQSIREDSSSAKVPNHGITEEINLSVVFDPEVLCHK